MNDLDLAVASLEDVLAWLVNPAPEPFQSSVARLQAMRPDLLKGAVHSWKTRGGRTGSYATAKVVRKLGIKCKKNRVLEDGVMKVCWEIVRERV